MPDPTTELDQRFSDPDAQSVDWAVTLRILEAAQLFWLTTVRADGRPHTTPLVAVWIGDAGYFCTGPAEQKALNLRANPHVALLTGTHRWDAGIDVIVEGEATPVTAQDRLRDLAALWATTWDGRWQFQVQDGGFRHRAGGDRIPVYQVTPSTIFAFGKGTFSQTRYRFPRA